MYQGNQPLSTTTVFSSLDNNQTKHVEARITHVNGKETSCFEVGCPYWVRVLPGANRFTIRYATNFSLGVGVITHNYAVIDVDVADMRPSHVYVARYSERGSRVSVQVEDLGGRPKYGITLGLDGVNKAYYPVQFD